MKFGEDDPLSTTGEELLEVLASIDPSLMDCRDADAVAVHTLRLGQAILAQGLRLAGSSHAAGFATFAGFPTDSRHLAVGVGVSNHTACEWAATAAFITRNPLLRRMVAANSLDLDRVRVLARAAEGRENKFAADVEGLLADATDMSFDSFCQRVQSWRFNTDPDDHDEPPDTEASFNERSLTMRKRLDGSSQGSFVLDAEATLLLEELFDSSTPDGSDAVVVRSTAQRHADSLAHAIECFLNGGDDGRVKRIMNTVVDLQSYDVTDTVRMAHGRLLHGTDLIPPAVLESLACDSSRRLIIRHGQRVLNVGDSQADLTPKQRLAVHVRDRGCQFRGCDRKGAWCHIHHLQPRSEGGSNELDNLTLLCGFHHKLVHHTRWTVERDPSSGRIDTYWNGPTSNRLTPEDLSRWRDQLAAVHSKN